MTKIKAIPFRGDKSAATLAVQTNLKARGYNPGALDSDFGSKTTAAISLFQKENGLNGSGILGPKTLALLEIEISAPAPTSSITKNLIGRKERRELLPELRTLLEEQIFPGGNIPSCFLTKDVQSCMTRVLDALDLLVIREHGGNNRGRLVGMIQSTVGADTYTGDGAAWCMSAMQTAVAFIEDYFQAESPVPTGELCTDIFTRARLVDGLTTSECERGTIWIARHGSTIKGHTGGVIEPMANSRMRTKEGNTGNSSISDGDGFFARVRNQDLNGDLKTMGYVRIYPKNQVPA